MNGDVVMEGDGFHVHLDEGVHVAFSADIGVPNSHSHVIVAVVRRIAVHDPGVVNGSKSKIYGIISQENFGFSIIVQSADLRRQSEVSAHPWAQNRIVDGTHPEPDPCSVPEVGLVGRCVEFTIAHREITGIIP